MRKVAPLLRVVAAIARLRSSELGHCRERAATAGPASDGVQRLRGMVAAVTLLVLALHGASNASAQGLISSGQDIRAAQQPWTCAAGGNCFHPALCSTVNGSTWCWIWNRYRQSYIGVHGYGTANGMCNLFYVDYRFIMTSLGCTIDSIPPEAFPYSYP